MYVNCAILPLKNQKNITEMLGDQRVNGQEAELSPSLALSIAALAKARGRKNPQRLDTALFLEQGIYIYINIYRVTLPQRLTFIWFYVFSIGIHVVMYIYIYHIL